MADNGLGFIDRKIEFSDVKTHSGNSKQVKCTFVVNAKYFRVVFLEVVFKIAESCVEPVFGERFTILSSENVVLFVFAAFLQSFESL